MKNIKAQFICWTIAAVSFFILCLGHLEHRDWLMAGLNGLTTIITTILAIRAKKQYDKLKNND